jgi:hypothetical protein
MLSHIASDLHQAYLEEVFKPQLGKPGASTPEKLTSSSDLDGDGNTDSFEKKVRQFIYDVRHLMRKNNIPVERAFQMRSSKTNYGAEVIKTAKEKLGIKGGGTTPVAEERESGEKLFSIVINYKNGTTYRKRASRAEISRLRSNPNVSSVEMTRYGIDGIAKKDYDGDGNIESSSKEHAGAVHNAIQRKLGGTPDGQDTRRKTSKKKLKSYGVSESFSNWRQDLKEVMGVDDEIASRNKRQVKERNDINNHAGGKNSVVKINPEVTEETEILGGHIVETFELDESYVDQVIDIATNFFYNCGLNENGIDVVIEELGEEKFNEFVFDLAEEYNLTEARRSGRIEPVTTTGKPVKELKGGPKTSSIKRLRKEKAKRREEEEKASAAKPSGLTAALKSQSETAKKIKVDRVKKATEKAKEIQAPSNKPRQKSIQDRVAGFILKGIERDRAARQTASRLASETGKTLRKAASVGSRAASEFGKGFSSGVRGTATAAQKTKKAVVGEEYINEKAESEQQQKLFGLALSVKRGQTPRSEASAEVLKIVDSMSEKKIRDFAKTPHSEVPKKKVNESIANPTPKKKSPLTTRKQKETSRIRVLQKLLDLARKNELGEEMEAQTQKQISARNLELRAEKMRIAADQQALQQKKNQQIEKNTEI